MAREKPSPENKEIALFLRTAFGGDCRVTKFDHDSLPLSIPIVSCTGRPVDYATSYSTVGLSDYPMKQNGSEYPVKLEIAGACASESSIFRSLIGTAAFMIIRSQWLCHPGAVLQDVMSAYRASSTLAHLYFTAPFLWEDRLKTRRFGNKEVAWLLAVPISQEEYQYKLKYGDKALEDVLEREGADVFDIDRQSVI
jgi:antitoxin YqcF